MTLYNIQSYMDDVRYVADCALPWEKLRGKGVMISGATGLIGSFLIDVLMQKNAADDLDCTVYALGRSKERFRARFGRLSDDPHLVFIRYDVKEPLAFGYGAVDYILHLASNTHPLQYSTDPIGTITTNIIGLQNLLEFAAAPSLAQSEAYAFSQSEAYATAQATTESAAQATTASAENADQRTPRFVFASSCEVYGENRGDAELFDEEYCGYINSNTMRAGYPESKRCGEALCQAYKAQKGMDVVIPRLPRTYGPTMLRSDSKAISQFIKKGVHGEDIVLKSAGTQYYSYQYVSDSVCGLLTVMLLGESGEAYNIADESSDIMLKDLAEIIANMNGKSVVFELPDAVEAAGYSTATKARLDGSKLRRIGWKPRYDMREGIERTIRILRELEG